jgi:ribosomal-protein-alanine N-acetyltransferase
MTAAVPLIELEDLEASHAPALFVGLNDCALYTFIEEKPPVSLEALANRYRMLERRRSPDGSERWLNWAVRLGKNGPYLGYVQATVGATGVASVAYMIFSAFWGRGFGEQAVRLMLNKLRDTYDVHVVEAQVDERNVRSRRLLGALEFEDRGRCGDGDRLFARRLDSIDRSAVR